MLTDADLDRMRGQIQRNGCLFRTDALALIEEIVRLNAQRPVVVTVIESDEHTADYRRWVNG